MANRRAKVRLLLTALNKRRAQESAVAHLCVVNSVFARRVCVQMTAHVFEFDLQLALAHLAGALESHVFQEMSSAICLRVLVSAASVDENANSGRFTVTTLQRCQSKQVAIESDLGVCVPGAAMSSETGGHGPRRQLARHCSMS